MARNQVPASAAGELVAGKYRLTRLLGTGGMGSVWEGVHASLGTRVAIKLLRPEFARTESAIRRFDIEARAAARLSSKHVVTVLDHGVTASGKPYIVMEFLSGESLQKRLKREPALSFAETVRIVSQVSRALRCAHENGIVHRDIKPSNVFLVRDDDAGLAKVVDFGIAKFGDASAPTGIAQPGERGSNSRSLTTTGEVLGTPQFMSPEQARGLRSVDYRSDLWSLGVLTFRCVTGRLPFGGEAVGDLLVQIGTATPPSPSEIIPRLPRAFDDWVNKALRKDPDERFQSAAEMDDALAVVAFVAGLPEARWVRVRFDRPTPPDLIVRPIGPSDSWAELTALLHRAYAPLARRGLRFYASHQDESVTREWAREGECFVALLGEVLVGTMTALPPGRATGCSWYARPDTASMWQFAVEPHFQGRGIGRALMDRAEQRARERGALWIAIDTSEHAVELIAMYRRRGYDIVDSVQRDGTNYRSVVLAKRL